MVLGGLKSVDNDSGVFDVSTSNDEKNEQKFDFFWLIVNYI